LSNKIESSKWAEEYRTPINGHSTQREIKTDDAAESVLPKEKEREVRKNVAASFF